MAAPKKYQYEMPASVTEKFQTLDAQSQGKMVAGYAAVDANIDLASGPLVVGIGSGSTVVFAVERLAQLIHANKMNVTCIPTSFQAKQLIQENKLVLGDLTITPKIDIAFDGADESDDALNLIKGGGGCLTQEKIIAFNSDKLVIVADDSKMSSALGTCWKKGIPVEVIPIAYTAVAKQLEIMGGKPKLRMAKAKAGPVVTDNGCLILDADFGVLTSSGDKSAATLEKEINMIPGVVENGLFVNQTSALYIGASNMDVTEYSAKA